MILSYEELQLIKKDIQQTMLWSEDEHEDLMRVNILTWVEGQIAQKEFKKNFQECSSCKTPFPRGTECPVCRF